VVTYPAVVEVDNPDEKLRPGMTTTITVRTHSSLGVPRIPNAALRYRPTPATTTNGKTPTPTVEPPLGKGEGRVWVLASDVPGQEKPEERTIVIGVTDGINTEVAGRSLPVGTKVVTDETDSADKTKSARVL
jgi:HlyD family secretion protein